MLSLQARELPPMTKTTDWMHEIINRP